MSRLKEVDDRALCIQRRKYGRGYQFWDEHGRKIDDPKLLKRLRSLVIPPMWNEVMICKWNDGHIQATGRDAKGRKQYIYHSEWERQRQKEKFARQAEFGRKLPAVRKRCLELTEQKGWRRDKVLALMVLILDDTGIRIGNARYAEENQTYGLSTLRRKHMTVEDDELQFEFKGKSGQQLEVTIEDDELVKLIKRSAEQPGYELFRYQEDGRWHNVDSDDINEFVRATSGVEMTSKDFRTWAASRLAIELYPQALAQKADRPKRKLSNILLRLVADELGNTPTVCRDYYVHPQIMRLIETQELPDVDDYSDAATDYGHSAAEKLLLEVIE